MANPIIFISRNRAKEGLMDDFKKHYELSVPQTEQDKPSTFAQFAYFDDDAVKVTIVRIFPTAEALDLQLQGADERSKITYQFIEPISVEIYGTASDYAVDMMKKVAGKGIPIIIDPQFIGGFIRSGDFYIT